MIYWWRWIYLDCCLISLGFFCYFNSTSLNSFVVEFFSLHRKKCDLLFTQHSFNEINLTWQVWHPEKISANNYNSVPFIIFFPQKKQIHLKSVYLLCSFFSIAFRFLFEFKSFFKKNSLLWKLHKKNRTAKRWYRKRKGWVRFRYLQHSSFFP